MASNARGQNSPPSYIDGISVKISEKYKPPKKITEALSYSQIFALNKLIQDSFPTYNFSLEDNIKIRVSEWCKVRSTLIEERKQRLQSLSQEENTTKWNQNENSTNHTPEVLNKLNPDNDKTPSDTSNNKDTEVSTGNFYSTESGVLIPMTVASQQKTNLPVYNIKNFNFSEFESDTSSPFDNMELKTINDLEELAEVLKRDSNVNSSSIVHNAVNDQSTNLTNVVEKNYINSSNVANTKKLYDNAYAYNISKTNYSKENHINGYYYNQFPSYASKLMHGHDSTPSQIGNDLKHAQDYGSSIRSVTEIMKSLEQQFGNNHLTENTSTSSEASSSAKCEIPLIKKTAEDMLFNPYNNLNHDLQKMAVTISGMGFPLPRVARACQALDGNQKKIVEHLLATSDLLDLGFSEQKVVNALLNCDNDRDKALDILIT